MTTQNAFLGAALPSFTLASAPSRSNRLPIRASAEPSDKSVEIMRKFSEQYARKSGTYFCVDKGVTSVVIKVNLLQLPEHFENLLYILTTESDGFRSLYTLFFSVEISTYGLADHKDSIGAPLCPCRHYDDKAAEVGQGFWNCPCVPMRERKECHCMLFLTADNDFAGKEQTITLDEIKDATSKL